jgi:YVTN family beta-propeller protein
MAGTLARRLMLSSCSFALLAARGEAQKPTGTLIASNMGDNTATIIDAATGRVLATLPTGEGPHEVAVSHDGRWAVITNYGVRGRPGNSIMVIDVARRATLRTLDLREYQRPHGVKFLPGDSVLAVTSETSQAVLLVNFQSGAVIATRPTSGRTSHMVSISANGDWMVTSNISDGTISLLRPSSADAAKVIRVATQPEGIAISPDGAMAWVGSNKDSIVLVVDLEKGAAVDTLRNFGLAYRMAVTPDGKTAVVTDPFKAQVRVFDTATRHERFLIPIAADSVESTSEFKGSPAPEGIAISNDSRWAFVTLQGRSRVATIDLMRGAVVGLAPTGKSSDGVGYSPLVPRP